MLECVVNVSEGRRLDVVAAIAAHAGAHLLDVHSDPDHHRSVLTLVGEPAARAVARATVATLDLSDHEGAHPRTGVLDVVPFAPLGASTMEDAVAARDRFLQFAGTELDLPCFSYGPERTLPEVRRGAFTQIPPDAGPARPHPTAGATAVGARPVLVAYNLWLTEPDLTVARRVAATVRSPAVRALGLAVGGRAQVSMNLIDPTRTGPAEVHDAVAGLVPIAGAELVGLVPAAVLGAIPRHRWSELDVADDRTIEARLEQAGLR